MGIVGPIGSGKTTILDGISFALFGRTPVVAQAVKSLINQRSDSSGVLLRFEVEGELWEAVRSFRRKGQSQVALYRLGSDSEEPEITERLVGKSEVDAKIEELLGLDFDAFGRSVLLAQGKFAELLQAPPAERDKVLKGVFGHERISTMRAIARARAEESRAAAEPLLARVERLAQVAARVEKTKSELISVEQRLVVFNKAEPAMAELAESEEDAQKALDGSRQVLSQLEGARTGLPTEADAIELIGSAAAAVSERTSKASAVSSARSILADAEEEQKTVHTHNPVDQAAELHAAGAQLRAAATRADMRVARAETDRQSASEAVQGATAALVPAEKEAEAAELSLSVADRELREAEEAMHRAHLIDMAQTLQGELAIGHECPVCHQEVASIPNGDGGDGLAGESARRESARTEREGAEDRRLRSANARSRAAEILSAAGDAFDSAVNILTAAQAEAHQANGEVEAGVVRLAELLGPGDAGELIEQRRQRISQVDKAVTAARLVVDLAKEALDKAVETDHRVGREVATLAVGLFELAGLMSVDPPDDDALEVLERWAADVYARYTKKVSGAAEDAERYKSLRDQARAEQTALLEELGVDDLVRAVGAIEQEVKMLGEAITSDEEELEAGEELIRDASRLRERVAVYQTLATDLRDGRFVRYLLDEERARLAHLGSEHLQHLTSGRYRFIETFEIEDLASAEAVRRADSLSGGESFLASLALALALAEMVSRGGGRLDAFFLDEGFGALDSEHLDLAMEGLESLVATGTDRLVVVVSHVPELRSRIEDLIELDRQPHTGDTIVVSGAARL